MHAHTNAPTGATTRSRLAPLLTLALALAAPACIVGQPLGSRDDGGAGSPDGAPDDGASAPDAPAPPDAARDDAALPDRDAAVDPPDAPRDAAPGPDAATMLPIGTQLEISATNVHPFPMFGGANTVVQLRVLSGPQDPNRQVVREVARDGDCTLREVRGTPSTPATVTGGTITVTRDGGAPTRLAATTTGVQPGELGTYSATITPAVAPGTVLHFSVSGVGSVPDFARDVTVVDVAFTPPTPVTESATARVLTRTPSAPLALSYALTGPDVTRASITLSIFTSTGSIYDMQCATSTSGQSITASARLLDAASPYIAMAAGAPLAFFAVATAPVTETLPDGTTLYRVSAANIAAGYR